MNHTLCLNKCGISSHVSRGVNKIRVAGENVKVGGGRYLRDAHAKRHSRYSADALRYTLVLLVHI